MDNDYRTRAPVTMPPPAEPRALPDLQADPIAIRLDVIVERARRRAPIRRNLQSIGRGFAQWLDRLAPQVPPGQETEALPPVIRFPFF